MKDWNVEHCMVECPGCQSAFVGTLSNPVDGILYKIANITECPHCKVGFEIFRQDKAIWVEKLEGWCEYIT